MSAKNGLFDPEYVVKERENILLVFDANGSFFIPYKEETSSEETDQNEVFLFRVRTEGAKKF